MNMKSLLLKIALVLSLFMPAMLSSQTVLADCAKPATNQEAIQCGVCGANGQTSCDLNTQKQKAASDLETTIANVLNVLSLLVGALAVIMVIVGGLRYVTSGGKQESVSAAKNTILYAAIGVVVAAVSQILIHFVLKNTSP